MKPSISLARCHRQAVETMDNCLESLGFPSSSLTLRKEYMSLDKCDGGEYSYDVEMHADLKGETLDVNMCLFSEFPFSDEQFFELRIGVPELNRVFVTDEDMTALASILSIDNISKKQAVNHIRKIKGI